MRRIAIAHALTAPMLHGAQRAIQEKAQTMTPPAPEANVMQSELLPCPFCGGEAERYTAAVGVGFENRQVQCRNCGASAFDKKWQVRPSTPSASAGEQRKVVARSLAQRFIERGGKRVTGSPYASWDAMPNSYQREFYEDADAVLCALTRPAEGEDRG